MQKSLAPSVLQNKRKTKGGADEVTDDPPTAIVSAAAGGNNKKRQKVAAGLRSPLKKAELIGCQVLISFAAGSEIFSRRQMTSELQAKTLGDLFHGPKHQDLNNPVEPKAEASGSYLHE
jgi:hypothetical protein